MYQRMVSHENGGGKGGKGVSQATSLALKKGPWTAAEDAVLVEYVRKHGEGNWNSVQKNSGLMRCGKSCRLRWANHLRPNLKKGSFSPEEERIIVDLHAKLGNKWARMASQLSGRTDNEIKNYWNTRMKRRHRAGLPLYPPEFQGGNLHQHQIHQPSHTFHFHQVQQEHKKNYHHTNISSFSLFDPMNNNLSPLDSMQNHLSTPPRPPPFYLSSPTHHMNFGGRENGAFDLPLSPINPNSKSPISTKMLNQSLVSSPQPIDHSGHLAEFKSNICFTSLMMGMDVDSMGLIPGSRSCELPSDQTPPPPTSPVSSNTSGCGGACLLEASSKNMTNFEDDHGSNYKNSGLLDALLQESNALSRKEKSNADHKGKKVMAEDEKDIYDEEVKEDAQKRVKLSTANGSDGSIENQCDGMSSFSQSSVAMKQSDHESTMEEMNSMDDDLVSLLNNFPSSMPAPDWYNQSRNMSIGMSHGVSRDGVVSAQAATTATNEENNNSNVNLNTNNSMGCSYWKNMPGIC